jgi:uncharacterized protein (TIGR03083 family)
MTQLTAADWLSVLRESQGALADLVSPLSPAEVEQPSYASEWSIAQVMSHLGSGAEIFDLFISAGLDGSAAPGGDVFGPIWQKWNEKSAQEQAADGLRTDAAFVDRVSALDDEQVASWRLEMFGGEQGLADVLRLRLGEHTVHSWDVAVARDDDAVLMPDAVELLIDHLGKLVARAGKPSAQPVTVRVTTTDPSREFTLRLADEAAELTDAPDNASSADATLRLPAEALIRLVYGRLDPAHTPPVEASGVDLGLLRQAFPGV